MGFGVTRKRLHWGVITGLVVYGTLFYLFEEVSESADALQVCIHFHVSYSRLPLFNSRSLQDKTSLPIDPRVTIFTLIPVTILDAIFYAWVFGALWYMRTTLRQSGHTAKLSL